MGDLVQTLADIKELLDKLTRSDMFKRTKHCHTDIFKSLVNDYNYIHAVIQQRVKLEQGIASYFLHKLKTAKETFEVKAFNLHGVEMD